MIWPRAVLYLLDTEKRPRGAVRPLRIICLGLEYCEFSLACGNCRMQMEEGLLLAIVLKFSPCSIFDYTGCILEQEVNREVILEGMRWYYPALELYLCH